MKITINSEKEKPIIKKSSDDFRNEISKKLNALSSTSNFAFWEGNDLYFTGCANVDIHNKLIILLSLFTDNNNREYHTYTSFNSMASRISIKNYNTVEKLNALNEFVDTIPKLEEVKIEIN